MSVLIFNEAENRRKRSFADFPSYTEKQRNKKLEELDPRGRIKFPKFKRHSW